MDKRNLAIICDGKELSFGFSLFYLMRYEHDEQVLKCRKYDEITVELYSSKVFERTGCSSDTLKIYIGKAAKSSGEMIFCRYGIRIWENKENSYSVICSDEKDVSDYDEFFDYANGLRTRYIKEEKEYFNLIKEIKPQWLLKEFKPVLIRSFFGKRRDPKETVQQYYDCAALIMYLIILERFSEGAMYERE